MNTREFLIALVSVIGFFAILHGWLQRGRRDRDVKLRRFDAMLEALRDPGLDPVTRGELARALAQQHIGILGWIWQRLQQAIVWKALWYGTGWMIMLFSGAALATYFMDLGMVRRNDLPPVVMTCVLGFGMLTLPLAVCELLRRERASTTR